MKQSDITRRRFLKVSAGTIGAMLLADTATAVPVKAKTRKSGHWSSKGPVQISYNYCDMCPWRCGVIVKSVDGKVQKIDGNPADPKSRGALCARGQAGVSFLYDPDRLKQPLIRSGERGAGSLRSASWNEALDQAATQLAKIRDAYGPESVAFFGHTSGDFWFTDYFPQAFGSPNAARPSMSLCTSPREEASLITYGRGIGNHEPVDWEQARCIVLIGTHIGEDARNTMMQDFANARARGAKVVVVDPRFSSAAMKADHWLPIKPGTDTALLLAWINVLVTEGRYDKAYVEKWTVGFEQLAAHVEAFTPEWAAPITDLSAEQIRESAREMGRYLPESVIVPGRHVTWYGNDTQRMRAVYIVNALLGAVGRPGGMYFNKTPFLDEHPHPPYAVVGGAGG
jgi:thiosulfate reductase/polysulfide reductase chain A